MIDTAVELVLAKKPEIAAEAKGYDGHIPLCNMFQITQFDFSVDENLDLWLNQLNAYPSMLVYNHKPWAFNASLDM